MSYPKKPYKTVVIRIPEPLAASFKAVAYVWEKAVGSNPSDPWQRESIEGELDYIAREGHSRTELIQTYLENYCSIHDLRPGERRPTLPRWQKTYQLVRNLQKLLG